MQYIYCYTVLKPTVWFIGVMCLHAAQRVQPFAGAGNGWPYNVLRYKLMPIRDCKMLLDMRLARACCAILSTGPLTFEDSIHIRGVTLLHPNAVRHASCSRHFFAPIS